MILRRLLPYALLLAGPVLLLGSLPTLLGGAETEPTPVELAAFTADAPSQQWVELSGGGFWLPGTIEDTETKKDGSNPKPKAEYVPYLGPSALDAELEAAMSETAAERKAGDPPLVLVKFKPDRYDALFPEGGDEDADGLEAFHREMSFRGLRMSDIRVPERLRDHVKEELDTDPADLIVVEFEGQPLQRGGAGVVALLGLGLLAGGAFWVKKRWTRAPTGRSLRDPGVAAPVERRNEMIQPREE